MRSLRRHLEVQLDTPWLLASRRDLITEELYLHIDDHLACLQEDGVPKDVALQDAWAQFGDLKAVAGEFLSQHRLEAYAFYTTYLLIFAGILWPLPSLLHYFLTGESAGIGTIFSAGAFAGRFLVTWELFWLFVLVRTAHCTASTATRRWVVIGLLLPGYVVLGLLGPVVLTFMFQQSLSAPWLHWFNPEWMRGWIMALQIQDPSGWVLSTEAGRDSFIVLNIVGLYLIRAYAVEGCWHGRDWPRLLLMTLLLSTGLRLFFEPGMLHDLNQATTHAEIWSHKSHGFQALSYLLQVGKQLLLVGYFIGGLKAFDALYGAVVKNWHRSRGRISHAQAV
ncbi:MAG: hypothetical protein ABI743_02605 [bacterium]